MDIVAQRRYDFSAARQLDGRWRGDNFVAWVSVRSEEFPAGTVGAVFERLDRANLHSILGMGSPSTIALTRAAWDELKHRLTPLSVGLESLELVEEDGDAVSISEGQTWHISQGGFSAAHRTNAPALSAVENVVLYGKCDNPAGHGHNYWIQIWSPELTASDVRLHQVLEEFDHKNLSIDIPDLNGRNVVTEAIAELVAGRIPVANRVRVWETQDFFAEYHRNEADYRLGRRYNFHAAHESGDSITGHNYGLQVTIKSPLDPRTEAAFDLGLLDRTAAGILDDLDHSFLNEDVSYFRDHPATAPNLVRYLWSRIEIELGKFLESVMVQDTPRSRYYTESDRP